MIALMGVIRLALMMLPTERPGGSGVLFTCPLATRSATSASLNPSWEDAIAGSDIRRSVSTPHDRVRHRNAIGQIIFVVSGCATLGRCRSA
jgi:hypothetical protein